MPNIAKNKQGLYDYEIFETYEAGIVLSGPEVKSIKAGQINLKGSYVTIDGRNEAWLIGAHISKYKPAAGVQADYDPMRKRKLLLAKKELISLKTKSQQPGLTILPISVYTKRGLIKCEIGLGRGKKKFDKREQMKKRQIQKDIRQRLKGAF